MKGSRLSRAVAGAAIAAALAGLSPAAFAQAPAADNQAQRLEPIVVTATRIEQRVSEQAADVTVVPRDVIELKSPVVAGDVLQGIPGVDAQQSGSPGNLQNVKIRGGKGTHTLVMIDGFAVNSPAGGEFDISSLPVGGFEQIEIVRGAQSALYGSNAMGGVVNFIPRKPDRARAAAAGLSGGSFDTLNWNAYGQGRGSAGDIHVGAGGVESSGSLRNDDLSLVSFIGVGNAALGTFSRLHMIVLTTDEQKGIPVDDRGFDPLAHKARRDFLGGARWEIALSRAAALTLSGAEFDEHLHIEEPPDPSFASSSDFLVKTRKTTARAELRYSFPKLSTTFVGVEYLKDRAQNDVISRFPPFPDFESRTSAATYNRSAFLQEELRFGKGDGLSLGIRGDRNSEAGTKWNPKVAGFHAFGSTGITARAAYGRGFRVPTIVEKFDPNNGNPDLSSESVDSYEAGLDWRPPRGRADVSATWFYQDFSDLIQTGTTIPPGRLFPELENVATAFFQGGGSRGHLVVSPRGRRRRFLHVFRYVGHDQSTQDSRDPETTRYGVAPSVPGARLGRANRMARRKRPAGLRSRRVRPRAASRLRAARRLREIQVGGRRRAGPGGRVVRQGPERPEPALRGTARRAVAGGQLPRRRGSRHLRGLSMAGGS